MLARHLLPSGLGLRLMYHRRPLAPELVACPAVNAVQAELAEPRTLVRAVAGVDTVVHFAGVLFAPRPGRFRLRSPLTRDFIRIGRVPYWGDTRRTRAELLPELRYPTLESGLPTL